MKTQKHTHTHTQLVKVRYLNFCHYRANNAKKANKEGSTQLFCALRSIYDVDNLNGLLV